MPSNTVIAAYAPVLHQGYLSFFARTPDASALYVWGPDLLTEEDYLRKELRAIAPAEMVKVLRGVEGLPPAELITKAKLKKLAQQPISWVLPDEDISHTIAEKYLADADVTFMPVFLRWDRQSVADVSKVATDTVISEEAFDKEVMQKAFKAARKSPDLWRQVGGALVDKNGKLLGIAQNRPGSTENTPWAEGDPRGAFKRGVGIEMSVFMHAEARLIAEAARKGVSLEGASLYATTFPCPPCAMLIANSGIKHLYFTEGYAVLDGKRVLDEHDVKIVQVHVTPPAADYDNSVPYPEKSS